MGYKDVAALVARVSLAGPVLYVGLSMALGPSGFVATLQKLARFLHEQFQFLLERFQLPHYIRNLRLRPPQPASFGVCKALRFTGVWLVLGAFLHIAGFLN
jgi:hypothetical protein